MKDVYAHNLAVAGNVVSNVNEYKSLGVDTNDASYLAQIGAVAFVSILVASEIEEIKRIVKKYTDKKGEIIQVIKNNFPDNIKIF